MRADPVQYKKYLQKRRSDYQKRKNEGLVKCIAELNKNEKKHQRKKWREKGNVKIEERK